jgi:hypothetical protein
MTTSRKQIISNSKTTSPEERIARNTQRIADNIRALVSSNNTVNRLQDKNNMFIIQQNQIHKLYKNELDRLNYELSISRVRNILFLFGLSVLFGICLFLVVKGI